MSVFGGGLGWFVGGLGCFGVVWGVSMDPSICTNYNAVVSHM